MDRPPMIMMQLSAPVVTADVTNQNLIDYIERLKINPAEVLKQQQLDAVNAVVTSYDAHCNARNMLTQVACYLALKSLKKEWGKSFIDNAIEQVFELNDLTIDERKEWDDLVHRVRKTKAFQEIVTTIAAAIKGGLEFLKKASDI